MVTSKKKLSPSVKETPPPADSRLRNFNVRIPDDVRTKLERVAKERDLPSSTTLVRLYISEGLAKDLERLEWVAIQRLIDHLKSKGVDGELLNASVAAVVAEMPTAD